MTIVEKLKEKYNLAPNSYLKKSIWHKDYTHKDFEASAKTHKALQDKWKHKYGDRWYGIEMTDRLPVVFYYVIDEFLEYLNTENPAFEIHQIKQKFNSIRIYIGNLTPEQYNYCMELENLLTDKYIAY